MNQTQSIPPHRLMDAVDAIFAAVREIEQEQRDGFPEPPLNLQVRAFFEFTPGEIQEAIRFLKRCGLF